LNYVYYSKVLGYGGYKEGDLMERRTRRVRLGRHLTIKSEYLSAIMRGEKITTIRRGIVVPLYDRVYLHSGGKIVGEVEIESTRYLRVKNLTNKDALLDGFKSKRELIAHLRKYYPDLNDDDWITILKFRLIKRISGEEIEEDSTYCGYSPVEIARLALAYGIFQSSEKRRILALVLTRGSIREAALELGGLHRRGIVRRVLREAVEKLIEHGFIKPKSSSKG